MDAFKRQFLVERTRRQNFRAFIDRHFVRVPVVAVHRIKIDREEIYADLGIDREAFLEALRNDERE